MRNRLLLPLLLIVLIPTVSLAQVDDVSFILSPKAGYDWFDANSTVDNGLMYGFDAGFGFGSIFELRGIYRHSEDLSQTFGQYQSDISDFLNDEDFSFKSRDISVRRYGGELKANILPGKYAPFVTLGTGVQTFKRDLSDGKSYKNKNIYASLGLGVKMNITDRITFDIGGKTFIYNMNPESLFYDPDASSDVDEWIGSVGSRRMYNWDLSAGLSFYLGGVNREKLSPLERAYLRQYSGKLYGIKFTFTPAGSYINFDSKSDFKDTFLLGGTLGVDFTDYFGLQAYYFHSTKNEKLSFNFDKMAMYGLDFVGKLNIPRGIVPFVTVGGGYINALDGYRGKHYDNSMPAADQGVDSKFYAKGGVGVEIPVSTYLSIVGSADLLYTKGSENLDIADISSTDQLRQHSMFTAGIRFRFGKKAHPHKATERAFENRFEPKRNRYEQKIKDLKTELDSAYAKNDTLKMKEIMKKREQLETNPPDTIKENRKSQLPPKRFNPETDTLKVELVNAYKHNNMKKMKQIMEKKQKMEARKDSLKRTAHPKRKGTVRMTREEIQGLINKTANKVVQKEDSMIMIRKLNHIEQLILNLRGNSNNQPGAPPSPPKAQPKQPKSGQPHPKEEGKAKEPMNNTQKAKGVDTNAVKGEVSAKMNALNQQLENQNERINQLQKALNAQQAKGVDSSAVNGALSTKVKTLNQQLENQNNRINQLQQALNTQNQQGGAQNQQSKTPRNHVTVVQTPEAQRNNVVNNGGVPYRSFSAFIGYSIGKANSLNIGVRRNFGFRNTSFFVMPAVYIAVAQNYGFGVNANGAYAFRAKGIPGLNPYAGLGLGINFVDGNFSLNPNFLVGTFYRLGNSGSVFFDYTVRGNFKYNQLSLGYRFGF
jgi:hypothetical protein